MKKALFLKFILLLTFVSYGQEPIPDVFELTLEGFPDQCTFLISDTDPSGTYVKYTGNDLGSFFDNKDNSCGCWDKVGSNEVLWVDKPSDFFILSHHPIISGEGCSGAVTIGQGIGLSVSFNGCNLDDFPLNGNSPCLLTITATSLDPIPTLSQWGIIALSMIMLILGLVFMRQRKVIFG